MTQSAWTFGSLAPLRLELLPLMYSLSGAHLFQSTNLQAYRWPSDPRPASTKVSDEGAEAKVENCRFITYTPGLGQTARQASGIVVLRLPVSDLLGHLLRSVGLRFYSIA